MANTHKKIKVLVIHGPNLNMLGTREPDKYGKATLEEINQNLKELGEKLGIDVEVFQSNHEGVIVEKIQEATAEFNGLIINPAAYTHTSVAIRDAVLLLDFPVIEVHLSNVYQREKFRHTSMISDIVMGKITGLGAYGYQAALKALGEILEK